MRIFLFAIIICFISYIHSETSTCSIEKSASSADDCKNIKLEEGFKYCCYIKVKLEGQNVNGCSPLTEDQYKNIDDYIDKTEKEEKVEIDKLDCKSYYLELCLLSLLFILL